MLKNEHSFFRSLNPLSKNSGILGQSSYCDQNDKIVFLYDREMPDRTVAEQLKLALKTRYSFLDGIGVTFELLIGTHYLTSAEENSKGILDFLILPLLSRRLLADALREYEENPELNFKQTLAWLIGFPIECVRYTAAALLTVMLIPVVAVVHLIKACLPESMCLQEENNNIPSVFV